MKAVWIVTLVGDARYDEQDLIVGVYETAAAAKAHIAADANKMRLEMVRHDVRASFERERPTTHDEVRQLDADIEGFIDERSTSIRAGARRVKTCSHN